MPTYFRTARFNRDYDRLSDDQRARFKAAVLKFIQDLSRDDGGIRKLLGIRPMVSRPGVFEFHFEGNGRATFAYGLERKPGEPHIIWRRIGTHDIYDDP